MLLLCRSKVVWLPLCAALLQLGGAVRVDEGLIAEARPTHSGLRGVNVPRAVVITVPGRAQSEERMRRLRPQLQELGIDFDVVEGPNMDKYCPDDIKDLKQSKSAGKNLLLQEWRGKMPDLTKYNLQLFQMATLLGHARAWKLINETARPAVILEDDASISSLRGLQMALGTDSSVNVVLLDKRHCTGKAPPDLNPKMAGLTGYWVDSLAAGELVQNFPVDIPVDWGVNKVFNRLKAICPKTFPLVEQGGESFARSHSAAHGCAEPPAQHPVASLLAMTVHVS